jgi:hypothetical protein
MPGWISTDGMPWKQLFGQNIIDAAAKTPCVLQRHIPVIFPLKEKKWQNIIIEEVPDEGMVFTGLPKEKHFLEMVCDCFVFSDLANA